MGCFSFVDWFDFWMGIVLYIVNEVVEGKKVYKFRGVCIVLMIFFWMFGNYVYRCCF